jgi:hypothetical protein
VVPREQAAVDFDPQALNPNENARLRINAAKVPEAMDLTVLMDGKLYFRRSLAGFKPQYDDLFVPPGVHEFRVRARMGPIFKVSNIVSAEFEAKKRQTLRIELRVPPAKRDAATTPQQMAEVARVFVVLR